MTKAKKKIETRDPDENYVWVEFTKTIGDYREGSTWRLDMSLAAHFLRVEKVCKKVKRPERAGPQAGGSLSNASMTK